MESAHSLFDPGAPDGFGDGVKSGGSPLADRYRRVRAATETLVADLTAEDQNLQSMAEASPAKWHRAHTTWFFETFILSEFINGYRWVNPAYRELFNSYYNGVGRQHPRPRRSLISRPDCAAVTAYREAVDARMLELLERSGTDELPPQTAELVELGLNHEQQHQELILTDLKHAFSFNPLAPALGQPPAATSEAAEDLHWHTHGDGVHEIGHAGDGFCFDNETPRHRVCIPIAFELASRPVTCGEFLEFMADGGYENPLLWLSDGWAWVQAEEAGAPLYWRQREGAWMVRTLAGERPVNPAEPVCHLNFYEAQAFAEWAGCRLPSEAEWEVAAGSQPLDGHFAGSRRYHPEADDGSGQWFGSVWEWTASAYAAYPGFRAAPGAVGEYNGKFMANQMVLRGGSCATADGHIRPTYRNFFYPADRWQFSGLRLARDAA